MSKELNDLKNKLRAAAASVAGEKAAQDKNKSTDPSFSSSEAAVQAILESLRNNEFSAAILYIQECRYNHWLIQAFFCFQFHASQMRNSRTSSQFRSPVVIEQAGSFRPYLGCVKLSVRASGSGIYKQKQEQSHLCKSL